MNSSVIAIVGVFFVIGITVGIMAVLALSAARASRPGRYRPGTPDDYGSDVPGAQPRPGWDGSVLDDQVPGGRPRWPGGVGSDFISD